MMLIGILFLLPPEKQDINAYFNEIKLDIVTIVYLDQEGLGELKQSQSVATTRPFRYALGHLHELITALHSQILLTAFGYGVSLSFGNVRQVEQAGVLGRLTE